MISFPRCAAIVTVAASALSLSVPAAYAVEQPGTEIVYALGGAAAALDEAPDEEPQVRILVKINPIPAPTVSPTPKPSQSVDEGSLPSTGTSDLSAIALSGLIMIGIGTAIHLGRTSRRSSSRKL